MAVAGGEQPRALSHLSSTIGGMLLDQQLRPIAEPLFAKAPRIEGDRMVWVVECPMGLGLGL